jgi:hypothetical protein
MTLIGTYKLGTNWIRLYVDPDSSNGEVVVHPKDKGARKIIVGIGDNLEDAISVFLHEAFEISYIDLSTRFRHQPSWTGSSSDFVFHMTHDQFAEACERVGDFMQQSFSDFSAAFRKNEERKEKKKGKK